MIKSKPRRTPSNTYHPVTTFLPVFTIRPSVHLLQASRDGISDFPGGGDVFSLGLCIGRLEHSLENEGEGDALMDS